MNASAASGRAGRRTAGADRSDRGRLQAARVSYGCCRHRDRTRVTLMKASVASTRSEKPCASNARIRWSVETLYLTVTSTSVVKRGRPHTRAACAPKTNSEPRWRRAPPPGRRAVQRGRRVTARRASPARWCTERSARRSWRVGQSGRSRCACLRIWSATARISATERPALRSCQKRVFALATADQSRRAYCRTASRSTGDSYHPPSFDPPRSVITRQGR